MQGYSLFYPLDLCCEKKLKMTIFMRVGKWEEVTPLPSNFFSVKSYDLKSLSLKFGNDTFITFEMPRVSYRRPIGKMNISMLFRPSVIRGPWIVHGVQWTRDLLKAILNLCLLF